MEGKIKIFGNSLFGTLETLVFHAVYKIIMLL